MGVLEQVGVVTTRILLAFIVFTVGTVSASAVKRLVLKLLRKINANRALALLKYPYNIERLGGILAFYLVYVITVIFTFWLLGIASFIGGLILLLIAILLVLTVASFSKDLLPNLYGWYTLKRKEKIKVGSKISFSKVNGKVEKIKFIETLVRSSSGDLLHVQNVLFCRE